MWKHTVVSWATHWVPVTVSSVLKCVLQNVRAYSCRVNTETVLLKQMEGAYSLNAIITVSINVDLTWMESLKKASSHFISHPEKNYLFWNTSI